MTLNFKPETTRNDTKESHSIKFIQASMSSITYSTHVGQNDQAHIARKIEQNRLGKKNRSESY